MATIYYFDSEPFASFGAVDSLPETFSFEGHNAYRMGGGQAVRFATNSASISYKGVRVGQTYKILQDGVDIGNVTTVNNYPNFEVFELASGLDTGFVHEYEILVVVPVSNNSGQTCFDQAVVLDNDSLAPIAHSRKSIDVYTGDSITNNYSIASALLGDAFLFSRHFSRAPQSYGHNGERVSTYLRDSVNNVTIPPLCERVIARGGTNDLGNTDLAQFQSDYGVWVDNIRAQIGNGKTIVCEQPLPRFDGAAVYRETYGEAIQSAIAGKADVIYLATDGWLTDSSDTADGLHPNAAGYAKIAAARILALSPPGPSGNALLGAGFF